jgi:hypothetical protein
MTQSPEYSLRASFMSSKIASAFADSSNKEATWPYLLLLLDSFLASSFSAGTNPAILFVFDLFHCCAQPQFMLQTTFVEASPPWSLYALALDQRTSTTTRSTEVKNAVFTESRTFSPDSLASISKHQKPIALDWPRQGHTGTYYAHELWYTRTSHEWSTSVTGHKLGIWTGSESGPSHNRPARSRERPRYER